MQYEHALKLFFPYISLFIGVKGEKCLKATKPLRVGSPIVGIKETHILLIKSAQQGFFRRVVRILPYLSKAAEFQTQTRFNLNFTQRIFKNDSDYTHTMYFQ